MSGEHEVHRLCGDAMFHAIRGINEINNQAQRLWSEFDTTDCEYHLNLACEYLRKLSGKTELVERRDEQ